MSPRIPHRRLPHFYSTRWLFITCHLAGSLPPKRYPPPGTANAGAAFAWMDRYLDSTISGPTFLGLPEVADLVAGQLLDDAAAGRYQLRAWVIMRNHIHVLMRSEQPAKVLQRFKGVTARRINQLLGREGQPFWQAESYDHCVRDDDELGRIARYIEGNPVRAGLGRRAEEYQWSSASAGRGMVAGAD